MKRLLLVCLLPLPVLAAGYPADLPAAAMAEKALLGHPAVQAARAGVDVGTAQRDRLEAGPHEFNLRLGSDRRREIAPDRRLQDREIGIERALRLPGKAAKDAEIGAAVAAQARDAYGDAVHETGRLLLQSWFAWRREQAAAAEWRAQAKLAGEQAATAARRVAVGDAARIELLLVQAQQTQAEAQLAQAENRVRLAVSDLARDFPALALPERLPASAAAPLAGGFDLWREKILAHSHELQLARGAARRQRLEAQREDAERLPDPTLGVKWASERDGQERVVGLSLSIPLPGGARAAAARAATAESAAADAREALVLARIEAEARRTWQTAQASAEQAQRLTGVAARIDENARLLDKAWRQGEGSLSDLLTARRQAIEARLAAGQSRLDADEARYRLLLDAHELWPLDAHDD